MSGRTEHATRTDGAGENTPAHVFGAERQKGAGTVEDDGSQLALPLSGDVRANAETIGVGGSMHTNHEDAAPGMPDALRVGDAAIVQDASFGARLVAARDRLGLSRADAASRLKLPARLVERIEADDYEGIAHGVFLTGYLTSYARLVGVPVEEAEEVARAHSSAAPLVSTGSISRSRYLIERYSGSATYLVLTALIVAPAVWLATHGGLEQNLVRSAPLDPAPAATGDSRVVEVAVPPPPATRVDPPAVIASMTPFAAAQEVVPESPRPPEPAGAPGHGIELELTESSWVEIVAADGSRIEYAMLAAGKHQYRSQGPVSVRIGNSNGAILRVDGKPFDLSSFQRGNVAHVRLFEAPPAVQ